MIQAFRMSKQLRVLGCFSFNYDYYGTFIDTYEMMKREEYFSQANEMVIFDQFDHQQYLYDYNNGYQILKWTDDRLLFIIKGNTSQVECLVNILYKNQTRKDKFTVEDIFIETCNDNHCEISDCSPCPSGIYFHRYTSHNIKADYGKARFLPDESVFLNENNEFDFQFFKKWILENKPGQIYSKDQLDGCAALLMIEMLSQRNSLPFPYRNRENTPSDTNIYSYEMCEQSGGGYPSIKYSIWDVVRDFFSVHEDSRDHEYILGSNQAIYECKYPYCNFKCRITGKNLMPLVEHLYFVHVTTEEGLEYFSRVIPRLLVKIYGKGRYDETFGKLPKAIVVLYLLFPLKYRCHVCFIPLPEQDFIHACDALTVYFPFDTHIESGTSDIHQQNKSGANSKSIKTSSSMSEDLFCFPKLVDRRLLTGRSYKILVDGEILKFCAGDGFSQSIGREQMTMLRHKYLEKGMGTPKSCDIFYPHSRSDKTKIDFVDKEIFGGGRTRWRRASGPERVSERLVRRELSPDSVKSYTVHKNHEDHPTYKSRPNRVVLASSIRRVGATNSCVSILLSSQHFDQAHTIMQCGSTDDRDPCVRMMRRLEGIINEPGRHQYNETCSGEEDFPPQYTYMVPLTRER